VNQWSDPWSSCIFHRTLYSLDWQPSGHHR